jgi:hypothetical protein
MSDAPNELELARQRLHQSRQNLQQRRASAFPSGLKLGIAAGALLLGVLARRKMRAGSIGLLLPLGLTLLKYLRKR